MSVFGRGSDGSSSHCVVDNCRNTGGSSGGSWSTVGGGCIHGSINVCLFLWQHSIKMSMTNQRIRQGETGADHGGQHSWKPIKTELGEELPSPPVTSHLRRVTSSDECQSGFTLSRLVPPLYTTYRTNSRWYWPYIFSAISRRLYDFIFMLFVGTICNIKEIHDHKFQWIISHMVRLPRGLQLIFGRHNQGISLYYLPSTWTLKVWFDLKMLILIRNIE